MSCSRRTGPPWPPRPRRGGCAQGADVRLFTDAVAPACLLPDDRAIGNYFNNELHGRPLASAGSSTTTVHAVAR
jgi:hypothetical protein